MFDYTPILYTDISPLQLRKYRAVRFRRSDFQALSRSPLEHEYERIYLLICTRHEKSKKITL